MTIIKARWSVLITTFRTEVSDKDRFEYTQVLLIYVPLILKVWYVATVLHYSWEIILQLG